MIKVKKRQCYYFFNRQFVGGRWINLNRLNDEICIVIFKRFESESKKI